MATFDKDSPTGGLEFPLVDDQIRTNQAALEERFSAEHQFPGNPFTAHTSGRHKFGIGTSATRDATLTTPQSGMVWYNSTTGNWQIHNGSTWLDTLDNSAGHLSYNALINGQFLWWQRWPSVTNFTVTTGARRFMPDRWAILAVGANMTALEVAGTNLATGATSDRGLKVTGAASGTSCEVSQRISYERVRALGGTSSGVGPVCISGKFKNLGTTTLRLRLYLGTPNSGVDAFNSGTTYVVSGAVIHAALTAGTSYSWSYTVDLAGLSNATSGLEVLVSADNGSSVFDANCALSMTDMRCEPGTVASVASCEPRDEQKTLCLRYYRKSFPANTAPATATGSLVGALIVTTDASGNGLGHVDYSDMMGTPALASTILYNPFTAVSNDLAGVGPLTWRRTDNVNSGAMGYYSNVAAQRLDAGMTGGTANSVYGTHYTIEAEI